MDPPGFLPRKDNAILRSPKELILRDNGVKRAARAGLRLPEFAARAGSGIRHVYRPRVLRRTLRTEHEGPRRNRNTDERDVFAVGRPYRICVAIDAGIKIPYRFAAEVVHPDEGVIGARVYE